MPKDHWAKARRKDAAKLGQRDEAPRKNHVKGQKHRGGVWQPLGWTPPKKPKLPKKKNTLASALVRALVQCWDCGHHQSRTTAGTAEALRCLKCGGAVELLVVDGVAVPPEETDEEEEAARLDSIDARYA